MAQVKGYGTSFRSMAMVDGNLLRAIKGCSLSSPGTVFRSNAMVHDGTLHHAMEIDIFEARGWLCFGFIRSRRRLL